MASVELVAVSKVFPDGTYGLRECSLSVDDGELLVVVGPSGCGKSTLLRLVAGLESITAGTLRIGDREVNDLSPQERNVAMVFQDYALYPFMTVRGNLEFPLRMRGLSRSAIDRQVNEAARLLDISSLLDRLPRQLSGGQRQRVAMGRALVRQPSVSLLDEPLSNLDARLRVQVRAEIGELQERTHTTMIYVTHDQVEAMTLGRRVAVLDKGYLQQVATPREVYERPANEFVAAFIGNPPMNLFVSRILGEGDRVFATIGTQRLSLDPSTLPATIRLPVEGKVGVRPEAWRLIPPEDGDGLRAQVEHVEYLGYETLVHVVTGDAEPQRWTARLPRMQSFSKGQSIALAVDPHRVHFFDSDGRAMRG